MKHGRMTAASFVGVLNPLAVLSSLAGLAASLAEGLPALGGDVPFTEHVISTAADGAVAVFAVDMDGDGDIDVLSASQYDDKIAWYECDGLLPPSFIERVIATTADGAFSVFATDVDGDGDTDVLSASFDDDNIAWYESDGGSPPTFTERLISTAADGAQSVFAADVDGDGDIDVLSASQYDDKIAWYESDGLLPPSFTERVISTTADGAWSVFATDVDGDGDTDVLSASGIDNKIAWYESDGGSPPTFTERVISTAADVPFSVFATDLDGDGDVDVLSASQHDDKIAWYESDGLLPPSFTEHVISTTADFALSVFATDVDGDGDTDVLSASLGDDKIAWYESDGLSPPSFTERVISTTADQAVAVFAVDLDGDGDTDVLSASLFDDKIRWYEHTPATCGNGRLDPGEDCDPPDGQCCSDTCTFEAGGTACGDPSETGCDHPDTCVNGTCQDNNEPYGPAPPRVCDDANDCTAEECDGMGACTYPNLPAGTPCDDGESCTEDDQCSGEPDNDCGGEYQVQVYADICLPYDPPNAPQPNLDDILCILDDFADGPAVDGCACNGFRNTTDLHPCPKDGGGDGEIGLDDIIKMLDAFAGNPPCPDPCP